MVDMYGFAALVDAIGGLEINVQTDIKYGGVYGTAGTIPAGKRVLNGEQVLWYGRSRVGSDDFSRMGRQRCVIGALAQQASPRSCWPTSRRSCRRRSGSSGPTSRARCWSTW